MTTQEISKKYDINQNDFEQYVRLHGLIFNYGLFSGMSIDSNRVDEYVRQFLENPSNEELMLKHEQALEEQRRKIEEENRILEMERMKMRKATSQMLVTSGFTFDGYRITKYSGYISGDDAMSVDRGYAWQHVSVRDELMSSLSKIRRNALQELKEAAYNLGCNAVIGVDFDYITLDPHTANASGGTTYQPYVFCVTANGNAVVIEKIEE